MIDNINTKPELGINFSDLPPGSYLIKDGKIIPNLDDEAMAQRVKSKSQSDENEKEEIKKEIKDKEV